jgi:hypothetical protein
LVGVHGEALHELSKFGLGELLVEGFGGGVVVLLEAEDLVCEVAEVGEGTPQEALDCACGRYLGDPAAWI